MKRKGLLAITLMLVMLVSPLLAPANASHADYKWKIRAEYDISYPTDYPGGFASHLSIQGRFDDGHKVDRFLVGVYNATLKLEAGEAWKSYHYGNCPSEFVFPYNVRFLVDPVNETSVNFFFITMAFNQGVADLSSCIGYVLTFYIMSPVGIDFATVPLQDGKFMIDQTQPHDPWTSKGEFTLSSKKERIEVKVDPGEINPLSKPQSKITVIAKDQDGEPAKGMQIEIKTCTELGSSDTDGHIHDQLNDGCSNRPKATLEYDGKKGNPIVAKTDESGKIILKYIPPKSSKYYISGKDKITATSKKDPEVKGENSIITRLPNLQPIPGSADCRGGGTYFFDKQKQHGCLFYGTDQTNEALIRIANEFVQKQIDCRDSPGSNACKIKDASNPPKDVTVKISGEPIPMKITAMSLPWGGLHDIKGKWKTPHKTHNDGKVADIGLGNLKNDKDLILLLRFVITQDSNFSHFEKREGGQKWKDHFHVYFKS